MAAHDNTRRIVRTYPGAGTCETIYEDEYGDRWRSEPHPIDLKTTTGQRVGYIVGTTIDVKTV